MSEHSHRQDLYCRLQSMVQLPQRVVHHRGHSLGPSLYTHRDASAGRGMPRPPLGMLSTRRGWCEALGKKNRTIKPRRAPRSLPQVPSYQVLSYLTSSPFFRRVS